MPLSSSPSLSQALQTPRTSSGITNTRWIWRLSAAAPFTTSCSNRACLSPHSWGGSPPRSFVLTLFFFLIVNKNSSFRWLQSLSQRKLDYNQTKTPPNRKVVVLSSSLTIFTALKNRNHIYLICLLASLLILPSHFLPPCVCEPEAVVTALRTAAAIKT